MTHVIHLCSFVFSAEKIVTPSKVWYQICFKTDSKNTAGTFPFNLIFLHSANAM